MRITNLDAGSYLCMITEKELVKVETEKKDKYLQTCLDCRNIFIPLVFSADGTPGAESREATQQMALRLRFKLKQEYSEMCSFVWASTEIEKVRSNNLLLRGPREKYSRIW